MAQVKIYGLHTNFEKNRVSLSESIHQSVMEALSYPAEKRFHRFIALNLIPKSLFFQTIAQMNAL